MTLLTQSALDEIVQERLSRPLKEALFMGQFISVELGHLDRATHDAQLAQRTRHRLKAKRESLGEPVAEGMLTIQSWQDGLTGAQDLSAVERAGRDAWFIGRQGWRDRFVTSAQFRDALAALDSAERWIAIAEQSLCEGWYLQANAAFAAARWLDPSVKRPEWDDWLPARFRAQPSTSFAKEPFMQRHWLAWDMKNYGILDVPTLLEATRDPNFSVRTRVFRSLGQVPHPAAIAALREGMSDPHFFARGQAIRSLGRVADPGIQDELMRLADDDPDVEVRRTARLAAERIAGFWFYFGQWREMWRDRERVLSAMHTLADMGLREAAFEVPMNCACDDEEIDALLDEWWVEREVPLHADRRQYPHYFKEAAEEERRRNAAGSDA